jgi:hypothetical protein
MPVTGGRILCGPVRKWTRLKAFLNHDSYSHLIESYCDLYSAIRRTRLSMRERV